MNFSELYGKHVSILSWYQGDPKIIDMILDLGPYCPIINARSLFDQGVLQSILQDEQSAQQESDHVIKPNGFIKYWVR